MNWRRPGTCASWWAQATEREHLGQQRSLSAVLTDVHWLQNLSPPVRDRVAAEAYESFHPKGVCVARRGEQCHSWIYVAEGLLKVSAVDRSGKAIMYAGVSRSGWVGEGSVIKREVRRYDILALQDSRLLHIPASTVRWLLDTSIEFNHTIIAQLNERCSQYISMVEIDRLQDPVARVAKSLAILFNPILHPSMTPFVPLMQQELGELAGLSRQSVSAALKLLAREGYVETQYGRVIVKDVHALRNYSAP